MLYFNENCCFFNWTKIYFSGVSHVPLYIFKKKNTNLRIKNERQFLAVLFRSRAKKAVKSSLFRTNFTAAITRRGQKKIENPLYTLPYPTSLPTVLRPCISRRLNPAEKPQTFPAFLSLFEHLRLFILVDKCYNLAICVAASLFFTAILFLQRSGYGCRCPQPIAAPASTGRIRALYVVGTGSYWQKFWG